MTGTEPDPAARRAETRQAVGDPVYREAFEMGARGESDAWNDEHRAAVRRARELTGTPAPGFPVPVALPESEDR
jgi:hypothetical protein